ncbi:helix-turn-helix domain-containing protein [Carnobacterium maltaromaticum]|uniref:Helix-turn-helix domain-containing protein n=1 Tax=Carnobacterium maltaromaticum TaxID=2751 RepID=A0AAW9JZF8_CARML|nr:helix-turn-helix domain-containing protein [Carnobacterium maltaromaticum]MDZ5760704.1 helix-turn-helix domain-containing protein [Carnobacterium maltaromaticum]
MKSLLELHELREYNLLSLLFEEERWWTVEELTKVLVCSNNVIYRAKKSINSFFIANGNELEIISQKGKGLLLKKYSDTTLIKYKSIYIQKCISYKMIDIIFRNPGITIERLANQLYISNATTYRKISIITNFLKSNGLILKKNKLLISGNTALIREVMYNIYWSISASGLWPFLSIPKNVVEYRLNEVMQHSIQFFSESEKIQLTYRFAINLVHYQQKHFISEKTPFGLVDPIRKQYLNPSLETLIGNLPIRVKSLEKSYLTSVFCSYPITNKIYFDYSSVVKWHKKNNTLAYQLTFDFLNELQNFYKKETLVNNDKLVYQFICISIYSLSFPKMFSITDNTQKLLNWFMNINYSFYTVLKKITFELHEMEQYKGKLFTPYYFLYNSLIILTNFYTIQNWDISLNIRIHCTQDSLSERLLKGELLTRFKDWVTVFTTADIIHSKKKLESFDLIISDRIDLLTSSSLPKEKTFSWNFPPTESEWVDLKKRLENIRLKKNLYFDN